MGLCCNQPRQRANSLFHDTALDCHQGVVDLDKIILAVFLQIHGIEVKLDDIAWVCPQPPLSEGVGRIRGVRETGRLDLLDVVGLCMFGKVENS